MSTTPASLVEVLKRRAALHRASEAARGRRVRERLRAALREEKPPGTRLWLIGSLQHEHFGPRSDVDIVVEGASGDEAVELWARLSARLETEVDVLRLEDLPDGFRQRVMHEGELLHAA